MKNILNILILLMLFSLSSMAQVVPPGMKYQAVARDLNGQVIANQNISLEIALVTYDKSDNYQYIEHHKMTTNNLGLFTLTIGDGEKIRGAFEDIPWDTDQIWLELSIDSKGGNDFVLIHSSKLLAVPYAFHAGTAGEIAGEGDTKGASKPWTVDGNLGTNPDNHFIGTVDPKDLVFKTAWEERMRITGDDGTVMIQLAEIDHAQILDINAGELDVENDVGIGGQLEVVGWGNFKDILQVEGHLDALQSLHVGTDLDVNKDAVIGNNLDVWGNLDVDGTALLGELIVENDANINTLGGSTTIEGPTTIHNTLDVDESTHLNITGGTTVVEGPTTIHNTLDVDESTHLNITGGTTVVEGPTTIHNTLDVDESTHLNITGGTTVVEGPTTIHNTLDVDQSTHLNIEGGTTVVEGPTSIHNTLDVDQSTHLNIEGGTTVVEGPTSIHNTLDVDQSTHLNIEGGTTVVEGPTTIHNTLDVDQSTHLNAAGGTTVIDGSTTINNTLHVTDNLSTDKCIQAGDAGRSMLKFNPDINNTSEGSFNNYPLQLSGNGTAQGMAIEVNGWGFNQNFMAFFAGGEMRGRIEGKSSFLINNLSENAQNLTEYDPNNAMGTIDVNDGDSTSINAGSDVDNAANNDVPTTEIALGPEVNTSELVELIMLAVDLIAAVITVVTSLFSWLDPLDIFEAALAAAISAANLGIFIGFGVANVGVAYESGSGDYAEWLQKDNIEEVMSYGDIVGVVGGKVSKEFLKAEKFMVVSAAPAVIGNMPQPDEAEEYETIAFVGQVPVKVRGEVHIGDYILPSGDNDGLAIAVPRDAMRAKDYGRIVGVAWEDWKVEDCNQIFQMINTAVGINQNDMANMIDQMQVVMNQMQAAITALNPEYKGFVFDTESNDIQMRTDYSVSATHRSKMEGYFDDKPFSNREELGLLVRDALVNEAGLDFSEIPVIERILLDPAYAESAKEHYTKKLDEYLVLLEKVKKGN